MINLMPINTQYSKEQCQTDALMSGLEPDALYEQICELAGPRMSDETLDSMLRVHGVNVRGLSKVDKARILVGVDIDAPASARPPSTGTSPLVGPSPASPSSRSSAPSSPTHNATAGNHLPGTGGRQPAHMALTCMPPPQLSRLGSSYLGLGMASRALLLSEAAADGAAGAAGAAGVPGAPGTASVPGAAGAASSADGAVGGATSASSPAVDAPCESGTFRRRISHLTAAMQPLVAPLATGAAVMAGGSSSGLAIAQGAAAVGAAGVAAVGGLTASVTTHEHHQQAQEMSRRLQRVAMAQDRQHHAEAQGLSATLQQQSMALDARQHRQGLWREKQQHEASMLQEAQLHSEALRVDQRLHFEGILATLREQDREADHDLWEQRTERFQMLMTVSSLLISGAFALSVEGQLPTDPGCLDLFGSSNRNCDAGSGSGTFMIEIAAVHCARARHASLPRTPAHTRAQPRTLAHTRAHPRTLAHTRAHPRTPTALRVHPRTPTALSALALPVPPSSFASASSPAHASK